MTKLEISPTLALPVDAVTQAIAFLGRRRAGKTYAAMKLYELMYASGAQAIALDGVGVWWGLRLAADGKSKGLDVPIFGGLHGDVPLEASAGALIADLVVDRGLSAVIDVSQFEHDTDRARFAKDFGKRFFYRKTSAPSAVHVFVEEAQEWVPQNPQKGEEHMLHAYQRMMRLGGNYGIGMSLISQRPQDVNKKALNQAECIFAFQLTGSHERKAVEGWFSEKGLDVSLSESLPDLHQGHAHVWSPVWLGVNKEVAIGPRETFAAGSTPKVGQTARVHRPLAPIDIENLKGQMAESIEKAKAEDPRALRAEIAELRRKLEAAGRAAPAKPAAQSQGSIDTAKLDQAVARAIARTAKEAQRAYELASRPNRRAIPKAVAALRALADELEGVQVPESLTLDVPAELPATPTVEASRPAPPQRGRREASAGNDHHAGGAGQRILDALAELEALGVQSPPRVQVAFMAGYTNLNSKGFVNAIGALRSSGQVDYPASGSVALTGAGRSAANASGAPRTGDELRARLVSMLGGASGRIVAELVKVYPDSIEREKLAERAGYGNLNSKGFVNAIGRLRSLGLIDYPQRGEVQAQKILFLEGR